VRDERPIHYRIFGMAKELEREGKPVIHMEFGDPYVEVDPEIVHSMCMSALSGHTHYSQPAGLDEFRERLAEHVNKRFSTSFSPSNVVVTPGSKIAGYLAIRALARPGEKIALVSPIWGVYYALLREAGVEAVDIRTSFESGWVPDEEAVHEAVERGVKAIIVNNPNNPTSVVLSREVVRAVAEIAGERGVYVIADEVYLDFPRGGFYSFLETGYENVVALYSFSKSYAMTGFRLGYAVADERVISEMTRLLQLYFTNVPEFIQHAGMRALEMPWVVERVTRTMWGRTDFLASELRRLGFEFVYPQGAFYVFAKVPSPWRSGAEFCEALIREKYVSPAPGEGFGGYSGFVRFSATAGIEVLREAVERIRSFLEEHGG